MKAIKASVFVTFLLGAASHASAFVIEGQDMRLGINVYMNGMYTYMSSMPMQVGSMIMEMPDDTSTFQTDGNILFNVVRDKLRANINMQFHNAFSSEGQPGPDDEATSGAFQILEAFGQYSFAESLEVRVGQFLSPFGIYNQIRYITPLFAPVVLPMMYEPPPNYPGHALVPEDANVMLSGKSSSEQSGVAYFAYAGNGETAATGNDGNKDKGVGGRIRATLMGNVKIGTSFYTANDEPTTEGRHELYGADLDLDVGQASFQAEYVLDNLEKQEDRLSYYARLTYHFDKLAPFVGYDFLKDKNSILFESGQERYSVGTGYTVDPNITLKLEYHYHRFKDDTGFMGAPDVTQMVRSAVIIVF